LDPKTKYEQEWNLVGLLLMPTPAQNNSSFTGPQNIPPTTQILQIQHEGASFNREALCFILLVFASSDSLLFPNIYTTHRSFRENNIHSKHNTNFSLLLNMMAHQSILHLAIMMHILKP